RLLAALPRKARSDRGRSRTGDCAHGGPWRAPRHDRTGPSLRRDRPRCARDIPRRRGEARPDRCRRFLHRAGVLTRTPCFPCLRKCALKAAVGDAGDSLPFGFGKTDFEVTLTSSARGSLRDLKAVLSFARRGKLQWTVEEAALEGINDAQDRLRHGRVAGALSFVLLWPLRPEEVTAPLTRSSDKTDRPRRRRQLWDRPCLCPEVGAITPGPLSECSSAW